MTDRGEVGGSARRHDEDVQRAGLLPQHDHLRAVVQFLACGARRSAAQHSTAQHDSVHHSIAQSCRELGLEARGLRRWLGEQQGQGWGPAAFAHCLEQHSTA